MDRSTHTPLQSTDMTVNDLNGVNVYGPDDSHIGDVVDVHGTDMTGQAIVDVGGFLGLGAKRVAVPVSDLSFTRSGDNKIHATTRLTKDQLKAMPEHA